MSATNQGPTATIDSAMSVRVGGGGHIHMGDTYYGGAEYKDEQKIRKKTTMVSLRQISETVAFLM